MLTKFISIFLCVMMLSSVSIVKGDEQINQTDSIISPLKKGQKAPFTGVELSPKAVAEMMTMISSVDDEIKIEVDKTKSDVMAQCNFKSAEQRTICETNAKITLAQLNEQKSVNSTLINQLKKEESKHSNTFLMLSLGFASGTIATILSVFAITQITK